MSASSLSGRAIALSLFLPVAVSGCKAGQSSADAATQPVSAAVAVVQRGNISHVLSLAGQFQPYQVIDVHAKVSGYVRHIYVDIGDRVRAGDRTPSEFASEIAASRDLTATETGRRLTLTLVQEN
jgi:multidrug efflux pump subunit AcrA (membrane-fusion protein)